ncbi:hypothetical protein [Natronorubrum texcoconense]|uniref:Uncharacterized protein n=1 Tax=Natronorubrum texcoconense TaxID=1095776 RepID=A0A1G9GIR6_9EURY|nr:hypothetical protein [Natronorubrum texcoconense]SDL00557.1 hypothetical protein SAMN04515672_4523 [Natronorubrum texcoconense]
MNACRLEEFVYGIEIVEVVGVLEFAEYLQRVGPRVRVGDLPAVLLLLGIGQSVAGGIDPRRM